MALDIVKLGNAIYFDYTHYNFSGFSQDSLETPKFWVFKNSDSTGVAASLAGASMSFRTGFQGHYYGNFEVSTGLGFTTGAYYNVIVSGRMDSVGGITGDVFTNAHTFYVENNSFDTLALAASDLYFADIALDIDDVAQTNEWTTLWYKNGIPFSGYSLSTLQVIKRDGTDLINVAMTGIGTGFIGTKYNATGSNNLVIDGESYIAFTTAYIDSVIRSGAKIISRDARVG